MDGIFIKRDDGRSILNCYLKQMENVKKGFSILVFPEGTRVYGDEFKEFQPTTLKVAFENYIAIAPMSIYGADKKRKAGNTKKVYITALKPVQPNNFITTRPEPLMGSLQANIVEKYNELKVKAQEKSK
ncbi:MAG: 1-acyl-sn-glycerol-3-phosphate acyltransferase [Mycoplasmoidaceae bacterium]|nr:1-acyl-sn-glycerol-3-phosphate acyltransferase [Mycoplasmoidaceae bacterium]